MKNQYPKRIRRQLRSLFMIVFTVALVGIPIFTCKIWYPIVCGSFHEAEPSEVVGAVDDDHIQRTSRSGVLTYETDGMYFRVEKSYKLLYEQTTEHPIRYGEISDSCVAVVMYSEYYSSILEIYDMNGQKFFSYLSCDGRITDISFNEGSTGAVITMLSKKEGEIQTKLVCLDFGSTEPLWISESMNI